jgi:hypothetical protein
MLKTIIMVVVDFIETVGEATLASLRATIYLPRTMVEAIKEYRHSQIFDAELDAALIDHCFLDRAMTGLTPAESAKIKRIAKELSPKA